MCEKLRPEGFRRLVGVISSALPITEDQIEQLRGICSSRLLSAGEFFIQAGSVAPEIGFLVSGFLRYFYLDEEGREFTRYFCRDRGFVNARDGHGNASAYSVVSLEQTDLVVFKYQDWVALMDSDPLWGRLGFHLQEAAHRYAEERLRSFVMESATTRYLRLLKQFPGIENRVRQYDIATYLGITPVALSRIRHRRR